MKLTKNINAAIIALVFFISVLSFIFFTAFTENDPVLKEAESFRAKSMVKGPLENIETRADYSDEIMNGEVFLVYAITSCNACKKELQVLSQSKDAAESKVKIFGIMSEDEQVVKDYIRENNIEIPILIDKNGRLFQELNLKYFPSNFKLNNGVIKKAYFGMPKDVETLAELVIY